MSNNIRDESSPLLDKKKRQSHYNTEENVSSSEEDSSATPFVWGPFIVILFMGLVQPMCFELIFPFINQMIIENGITEDPEQVGFYSGLIESIFQVMSFLAILPSSYISDHLGRKPVVLFGTAGMALSISLFGISKTYLTMIATRCIGGTLGGTWSALKVMMAEIYTNRAHRASALSTFAIAFRVGQIAGQPLGGLLSHPARTMPIFNTTFWRNYPFSLPCFIAAAFAVTSVICAYFTLEETLPKRIRANIDPSSATENERNVSGLSHGEGCDPEAPKVASIASVLTPHVMSVLGSIFVMTFISETVFALYPLFAFTPIESGGLGLSEPQIGAHMAIRSALNILILFAYVPFASRFGAVRIYHTGMTLWPLVIASLPALNALARTDYASIGSLPFNVMLLVFFVLWSISNLVWPSSQIVVIEAAPTPETLARINSLAQMVQTFTMALAPATVTSLFAFSVKNQILGGNFTYIVMLVLGCGGALHSLTLKEPLTLETSSSA